MPDTPTPPVPAANEPDLDEVRTAEQEKLYGEYIAIDRINIGGARAFNIGDPVPATHVSRGVVESDAVARLGTKAATAALESIGRTITNEKG